jgi:hypothetical protein
MSTQQKLRILCDQYAACDDAVHREVLLGHIRELERLERGIFDEAVNRAKATSEALRIRIEQDRQRVKLDMDERRIPVKLN